MKRLKNLAMALLTCSQVCLAAESLIKLDKAPIDLSDYASLQRGARLYMDKCAGCHSLKLVRYDSLAKGIEITDEEGNVLEDIVEKTLMYTGTKLSDAITTNMPAKEAAEWFGNAPPDLSLVARSRGIDWLYTYLRTFYRDPSRPWGVNNLVYPNVGMPHVLEDLQGVNEPVFVTPAASGANDSQNQPHVSSIQLSKSGKMSTPEYDRAIADLVNFLSYVSEPVQLQRRRTGVWVLVFLGVFLIFSYLLKREYWKDVH